MQRVSLVVRTASAVTEKSNSGMIVLTKSGAGVGRRWHCAVDAGSPHASLVLFFPNGQALFLAGFHSLVNCSPPCMAVDGSSLSAGWVNVTLLHVSFACRLP